MEALGQPRRAPPSKNEYLGIVNGEPEYGCDVIEIDMESFESVIQSNLNNHNLYYYGGSDCMNR